METRKFSSAVRFARAARGWELRIEVREDALVARCQRRICIGYGKQDPIGGARQ
jgi:hypothetical protein